MVTKQEFATLVVAMQAMYGEDFIGTEEALDVWYALLHDLDYHILSKALQQYMLTNKFKPTVAELRDIYTELVSPSISKEPLQSQALFQVYRLLHRRQRHSAPCHQALRQSLYLYGIAHMQPIH